MAQSSGHLVVAELWTNWHTNFWGLRIVSYSLFWRWVC